MPRVSVVVTAYNEGEGIVACLDRVLDAVTLPCEVLVVYDSPDDTTAPFVEDYARRDARVVPTVNTYGRGPARAIRFGFDSARSDVVVVTCWPPRTGSWRRRATPPSAPTRRGRSGR